MRLARPRGFTLIELLVGIALLAIILRLALPGFSAAVQNTQLRAAAESVLDGLQSARAEAVRRNRSVSFTLGAGNSWTVGCATPVAGDCDAVLNQRSASEGATNAVVTASQVGGGTTVFTNTLTFSGLGRVLATTLPAGATAQIDITNPTGGTCAASGGPMRCLRVTVTTGGQVRMCDPAAASGDSRAC
jgi:type IV fimbrial biogenesis protein FimT